MSINILFYYIAVHFIFTPSPNIEVYQLAHYQCSVDHTGVTVTWLVNGTASTNNDIIQLGIVTNGAGSSNSSLTIPGCPQYNNTAVRCNAFGSVDGSIYFNYSESTLRIQHISKCINCIFHITPSICAYLSIKIIIIVLDNCLMVIWIMQLINYL